MNEASPAVTVPASGCPPRYARSCLKTFGSGFLLFSVGLPDRKRKRKRKRGLGRWAGRGSEGGGQEAFAGTVAWPRYLDLFEFLLQTRSLGMGQKLFNVCPAESALCKSCSFPPECAPF